MSWVRWVIVALGLVTGGYMLFDGARALIVGDYLTPSSGQYAGQLGPWSKLVSVVGIEPRSTVMKVTFVFFGAAWLLLIVAFLLETSWSWRGLLVVAGATLWYVPVGSVTSLLIAGLLLVPSVRAMS